MMSNQDVLDAFNQRAQATAAANTCCSCTSANTTDNYTISGGVSSSDTVFGYSSFRDSTSSDSCGPRNTTYYWWDCYTGAAEGDKNNRGWSVGSIAYYKTATPPWYGFNGGSWYNPTDPNNLAMASAVIFEKCVNGKLQTQKLTSNGIQFSWSLLGQTWTGP
jgi:hypothetical protein